MAEPAPAGRASGITTATATRRGTRPVNADAAAIWVGDGATAAAVVDGIGNSPEVAATSGLLAQVAVRVGLRRGPLAGLLAAGELLDREAGPDAVAVLAVTVFGDITQVAWVGDCRAYGWDATTGTLRQYTTVHTVGQQLRVNGASWELAEDHDNWIRTTLGRAVVATVYQVEVDEDLLLLTSDGVHDQVSPRDLQSLVQEHQRDPQGLAEAVVAAAQQEGGDYRDDATAVVIVPG